MSGTFGDPPADTQRPPWPWGPLWTPCSALGTSEIFGDTLGDTQRSSCPWGPLGTLVDTCCLGDLWDTLGTLQGDPKISMALGTPGTFGDPLGDTQRTPRSWGHGAALGTLGTFKDLSGAPGDLHGFGDLWGPPGLGGWDGATWWGGFGVAGEVTPWGVPRLRPLLRAGAARGAAAGVDQTHHVQWWHRRHRGRPRPQGAPRAR